MMFVWVIYHIYQWWMTMYLTSNISFKTVVFVIYISYSFNSCCSITSLFQFLYQFLWSLQILLVTPLTKTLTHYLKNIFIWIKLILLVTTTENVKFSFANRRLGICRPIFVIFTSKDIPDNVREHTHTYTQTVSVHMCVICMH